MNREEYRKHYLDKVKSNLTNEDRINMSKKLKDLENNLSIWKARSQIEIESETDYDFVKFAKETCLDIKTSINDIKYILNED